MTEQNEPKFTEMWALVELMGHVKVAGRVTEETHFGTPLMRCDIPTGTETYFTQWYGGAAIYRITPIDESVARAFSVRSQPVPVRPYELAAPSDPMSPFDDAYNYETDDDEDFEDDVEEEYEQDDPTDIPF